MDPTERQIEILKRLDELQAQQKPFVIPQTLDEAKANPINLMELLAYGDRAAEMDALTRELIELVKSEKK